MRNYCTKNRKKKKKENRKKKKILIIILLNENKQTNKQTKNKKQKTKNKQTKNKKKIMHDKLKEKKGTNITYSLNDSGQQSNSESTSTTATTTTTVEEEGLKNDNSLSRNQSSFFKFKKMDVQTLTFQDALDALLTAHSNEVNTIRLEMMKKQTLYERELSMAKAESAMEFDKTYWEGEIKKRDEKIEDLSNKLEESQK